MPSSRPGYVCLRVPVDMGGSAQEFRSLASHISAANLRVSYHEPEYVRLCHTDGIGLGWILQDGVECPLSGFYFSLLKSEFRADNPPTFQC